MADLERDSLTANDHLSEPPAVVEPEYKAHDDGVEKEVDDEGFHGVLLSIVLVGSLVELISAGKLCDDTDYCGKEFGWAVAVGTISMACALFYLLAAKFMPGFLKSIEFYYAVFLFLLWVVGVAVLTFDAPFQYAGNGYFACWMCFFASGILLLRVSPKLSEYVSNNFKDLSTSATAIFIFMLSTVTVLIAASIVCNETACSSQTAFAIAISCISIVTIIAQLMIANLAPYAMYTAGVMVVFWFVGAGIFTFEQPFTSPGNGYFASWAALLSSCAWFYLSLVEAGVPGVPGGVVE